MFLRGLNQAAGDDYSDVTSRAAWSMRIHPVLASGN